MAGEYHIERSAGGEYFFILLGSDGEDLLTGTPAENAPQVEKIIDPVRLNAPYDTRYQRHKADDGTAYFTLQTGSSEVIGQSRRYPTEAHMEQALQSVKEEAPE